jgi:hypothetical protein
VYGEACGYANGNGDDNVSNTWIMTVPGDWRERGISHREKRSRYFCSREWGVLKESVRERCGNTCERCKARPMYAVHHLTYERMFCEDLADLLGVCDACHEYLHGKRGTDPRVVANLVGLFCSPKHFLMIFHQGGREYIHVCPADLTYPTLKMLGSSAEPGDEDVDLMQFLGKPYVLKDTNGWRTDAFSLVSGEGPGPADEGKLFAATCDELLKGRWPA